jgi:RP/EB family microtubule-associated protein
MCQWIKKYFELHYSGQEYDPVARRGGQDLFYILGGNKVAAPTKAGTKPAGPTTSAIAPATQVRPTTATQKPKPVGVSKIGGGKTGDVEALEKQVAELSSNNQILDKEREFYFSKLRLIEEMI